MRDNAWEHKATSQAGQGVANCDACSRPVPTRPHPTALLPAAEGERTPQHSSADELLYPHGDPKQSKAWERRSLLRPSRSCVQRYPFGSIRVTAFTKDSTTDLTRADCVSTTATAKGKEAHLESSRLQVRCQSSCAMCLESRSPSTVIVVWRRTQENEFIAIHSGSKVGELI